LRCLKENRKLLMFPEGTRVQEGENVEAKAGAALFATRTGSPLLPVYIPAKKNLFRPTTVVIGKPYYPQIAGRKATNEELQSIAADLMERVRALGEGQK
jgi:1-acyl-sn-glycerol-3-phosphate acyltransferase